MTDMIKSLNPDTDLSWWEDAYCRTEEGSKLPWFGLSTTEQRHCKNACLTCPVQKTCLSYALDNEIGFFVFGGHTARERAHLFTRNVNRRNR